MDEGGRTCIHGQEIEWHRSARKERFGPGKMGLTRGCSRETGPELMLLKHKARVYIRPKQRVAEKTVEPGDAVAYLLCAPPTRVRQNGD